MSVLRQFNWLSQGRIDIPDLRSIESSIVADFDLLAGDILGGGGSYVVKGFTIDPTGVLNPADNLVLNVDGGIVVHRQASEAGSIFVVPSGRTSETLGPTNSRIVGSFTASSVNYVGLDLVRAADTTTSDLTRFLDADSLTEISRIVPKARTLDYKIVISTEGFGVATNILPIAIVTTDVNNNVTEIEDARPMLFGLSAGGDNPNADGSYSWPSRVNQFSTTTSPSTNPFTAGDKLIESQKAWMDSVMTRLWELGGGEAWYSATSDRDIKLAYGSPTLGWTYLDYYNYVSAILVGATITGLTSGASALVLANDSNSPVNTGTLTLGPVTGGPFQADEAIQVGGITRANATGAEVSGNGQNFNFQNISGTYYISWSGLKLVFANSTATYNTIATSAAAYSANGAPLPDGYGLYVDVDRETDAAEVVPYVGALPTVGSPVRPGSRFLLAWRIGTECYVRDQAFEVNRSFAYATDISFGVVRLYANDNEAFAAPTPEVLSTNSFDAAYGVPKLNSAGTKLATTSGTLATWSIAGAAGGTDTTPQLAILGGASSGAGDYFASVWDGIPGFGGALVFSILKPAAALQAKVDVVGQVAVSGTPASGAGSDGLAYLNLNNAAAVGDRAFSAAANGTELAWIEKKSSTQMTLGLKGTLSIEANPASAAATDALAYLNLTGSGTDRALSIAMSGTERFNLHYLTAGKLKMDLEGALKIKGDPFGGLASDALLYFDVDGASAANDRILSIEIDGAERFNIRKADGTAGSPLLADLTGNLSAASTTATAAVTGTSANVASAVGVLGETTNASGAGVYGTATTGTGVKGYATSGYAVAGEATTGGGVKGETAGGPGVYGKGGSGYGVVAESDTTSPALSAFRIVPQDSLPPVISSQDGDICYTTDAGAPSGAGLYVRHAGAWTKLH